MGQADQKKSQRGEEGEGADDEKNVLAGKKGS